MSASKAKTLYSLFKPAVKKATKKPSSSSSSSFLADADKTLKQFVSSLDTSPSSPSSTSSRKRSPKPTKKPAPDGSLRSLLVDPASASAGALDSLQNSEEMTYNLSSLGKDLSMASLPNSSNNNTLLRLKEVSRERKQKLISKKTEGNRFNKLIKMCGDNLGTKSTMEVFDKLGRETGLKEYNALIAVCLEKARTSNNEDDALEHISEAFTALRKMKERGFQVEEGTYGPLLLYFIDMGMVNEFFFVCEHIKEENMSSQSRLGYYEMLLWIGVNNEEKIQELCDYIAAADGEDDFKLKENYLLALFESDRKNDLMQLLEIIDLTRISSVNLVAKIFQALGRLSLEPFAEKFILALKDCDNRMDDISRFIFSYASSIPNLVAQDFFLKFKSLHMKFKITPSSTSYEKLITYCCDLRKVHLALDIVEQMCEMGLSLAIETLHRILHACEEFYEFNLVRRIYSLICCHSLKPNSETFRSMINLYVNMKDFDSAYAMLNDMKKLNITPTASIYNAILAGYFREKYISGALMVLKQMECEGVKPDSQTFSYLISNCYREEDITKYCEEMERAEIQVTKHFFMALINAYTSCRQFEKAKQVPLDERIPVKSLNEIKSALVSALALSGQMPDALNIYKEIKQNGGSLEPKAAISLIEHFPSDGELGLLLQLLDEVQDPDYWVDGCCRVILQCVRHKHLRSAVDLFKQLRDKFHNDDMAMEVIFDEVFSVIAEREPTDTQIGLALLQAIKNELGLSPSRKSLDFLLNACVSAKDLQNSLLIWNEYQAAGLPYNVLTFLRMYQALLASGDTKSAKNILTKIPRDDPHVRCVIKACQITYLQSTSSKTKKKKNSSIQSME
ncbi:hypothetical protein PTKIN_Ptkin14bG0061600 [Pterospermum kingtungense]